MNAMVGQNKSTIIANHVDVPPSRCSKAMALIIVKTETAISCGWFVLIALHSLSTIL